MDFKIWEEGPHGSGRNSCRAGSLSSGAVCPTGGQAKQGAERYDQRRLDIDAVLAATRGEWVEKGVALDSVLEHRLDGAAAPQIEIPVGLDDELVAWIAMSGSARHEVRVAKETGFVLDKALPVELGAVGVER